MTLRVRLILLIVFCALSPGPAQAKDAVAGYRGLEFFGSSQITRLELEKSLGLRPGASLATAGRAADRLKSKLESRNLRSNIDIAETDSGFFITVDINEPISNGVPTRNLKFPHHVDLSTEHPFVLFDEMLARRGKLAAEGKQVQERVDDYGIKGFTDMPCNRIAEQLLKVVPQMRGELLEVISSDPDAGRRSKSIEVLNWGMQPIKTCYDMIPALDDASEQVRASAARFIFPRLRILPPDFPLQTLVEAFSHQLTRQSHVDRMLALRALLELGKQHPDQLRAIKIFDEDKLKQLTDQSAVPAIKRGAQQLMALCQNPPPIPVTPEPVNEF